MLRKELLYVPHDVRGIQTRHRCPMGQWWHPAERSLTSTSPSGVCTNQWRDSPTLGEEVRQWNESCWSWWSDDHARMYERYFPQFLPETNMEVDEGSLQTNTSKAQLGDILQGRTQSSISFAHICGQIALVIIDLVKTWTSCSLLSNLNRPMSSRYRNSLMKLWPCHNFDPCQCQCVLFQRDICSQWDQASQSEEVAWRWRDHQIIAPWTLENPESWSKKSNHTNW